MIEHAIAEGLIGPGSTIIESSSGNMGIALAQICSQYKLPFICIVDTRTNLVNINIMKAYGATIELAKPPDGGDLLKARLARVNELLASIPNSYWPNQYANPYNPISHEKTMQEIDTALAGKVDYLFAPISTCGTIRGCSDYIKKKKMKTKIYAVDAFGSIIFGGKPAPRLLPGHGASIRSALFRPNMADDVVYVR